MLNGYTIAGDMPPTGKALPSEYVAAGWCRGAAAIEKDGSACDTRGPNAAAVCLTAALERALPARFAYITSDDDAFDLLGHMQEDIYRVVVTKYGRRGAAGPLSFNDRVATSQAEVIEALQEAEKDYDWKNKLHSLEVAE